MSCKLTILQHNCNRSTTVMQGLMESGKEADVIAIQEPYIGDVKARKRIRGAVELGGREITVGNGAFDIIYRPGKGKGEKSRVMWMVRKERNLKYVIRDDIWTDWDASIMDIRKADGKFLRIVNIYNQAHKEREGWCMTRFPVEVLQNMDTIMLGDFNAKSPIWDSVSEPIRNEEVEEAVEKGNMMLLNEPDRITWQRGNQSSVIDLAFATQAVRNKIGWKIKGEYDTGSDHAVCEVTIAEQMVDIYEATSCRWDYRNADWERVRKAVKEEKGRTEEEWKYAMENEDCEEAARLLEKVMKYGIEQEVGEAKRCPRSKRWFDEEVKNKRKEIARKRRWGRKGTGGSEIKLQRVAEWKKKRTEYFRLVREKKKECWDKLVQNTEEGNLWDVWRVASQKKYAKTPALDTTDGIRVTFEEKETTFLKELFPKAPSDPPRIDNGRGGRERITISEGQAQEAISRQGSYKAPGPDEIGFKAIKELWEVLGDRITECHGPIRTWQITGLPTHEGNMEGQHADRDDGRLVRQSRREIGD